MEDNILSLSDRGQVTIPKKFRTQVQVKHFICSIESGKIILEPLQTRGEFLRELEESEQKWISHGGLNLRQMKKKYKL